MTTQKKCLWCGALFTPEHGNSKYCRTDHEDEARKLRQKVKRDPIARFLPILMGNHLIIDGLNNRGITELTKGEFEAYGLDISLCRHMLPPAEHLGKMMLDFGDYYLVTDPSFLTFKIYKHADTLTSA
jgi:hypothetical protein